jgi:hypothetical protein
MICGDNLCKICSQSHVCSEECELNRTLYFEDHTAHTGCKLLLVFMSSVACSARCKIMGAHALS